MFAGAGPAIAALMLTAACGSAAEGSLFGSNKGGDGGEPSASGGAPSIKDGADTGGAPDGVMIPSMTTGGATSSKPSSGGAPSTPRATGGASSANGGSAPDAPDAAVPTEGGPLPSTGSLPPASDLGTPGPFTAVRVQSVGPMKQYELYHPQEFATVGTKLPLVVFGPSTLSNCSLYLKLLQHLASHGFVVGCYNAAASGANLITGIDWLMDEAASRPFAGKLDTAHIAVVGQSAGSIGAFDAASDPRITTTVHLQGGTNAPHTATGNLHAPAQFLCGETPPLGGDGTFTYDSSNPNCAIDFQNATVPVFYGSLKGGGRTQVIDIPSEPTDAEYQGKKTANYAAVVGWLRWLLAADETQKGLFVGPKCELCGSASRWTVEQKDLEKIR